MATTWLITREADDASEARANAIRVPCVETTLLPWPWPTLSLSPRGGEGRGEGVTLFTSRRAVAAWIAAAKPPLGEVAALSPSTSEKLKQEGITPALTSEGGVIALANEILAWWTARGRPPLHLRYPTSDHGLRSPEQAEAARLLAKLGELDRRLAYEITAPAGLRESLERSAQGDWAISFASPSAVHHFFAAGAVFSRAPSSIACLGASTERSWNSARPRGWPQAVNTRAALPNPEVTT